MRQTKGTLAPGLVAALLLAAAASRTNAQQIPVVIETVNSQTHTGALKSPGEIQWTPWGTSRFENLDLTRLSAISFLSMERNAIRNELQRLRDDPLMKKDPAKFAAELLRLAARDLQLEKRGVRAVYLPEDGLNDGKVVEGALTNPKNMVFVLTPSDNTALQIFLTPDQIKTIHFHHRAPQNTDQTTPQKKQDFDETKKILPKDDEWVQQRREVLRLKWEISILRDDWAICQRAAIGDICGCDFAKTDADNKCMELAKVHASRLEALKDAIKKKEAEVLSIEKKLFELPVTEENNNFDITPLAVFVHTPCVTPVPDCEEDMLTGGFEIHRKKYSDFLSKLRKQSEKLHAPLFDTNFARPAHFPEPRFALNGQRMDGAGVIIYEGMRFTAVRDGSYVIAFAVSAPKTAVTIDLQLDFTQKCQFTLTIPSIELDPRNKSFRGNNPREVYYVTHVGYSSQIAQNFGELPFTQLNRTGSARIGSWPEGINRFESVVTAPVLSSER